MSRESPRIRIFCLIRWRGLWPDLTWPVPPFFHWNFHRNALLGLHGDKWQLYKLTSTNGSSSVQSLIRLFRYFQLVLPPEVMTPYSWVPLVLLIIFVIFFPVGWGSITYILVSELVPTMVRTETAVLCNSWEQLLQVRDVPFPTFLLTTFFIPINNNMSINFLVRDVATPCFGVHFLRSPLSPLGLRAHFPFRRSLRLESSAWNLGTNSGTGWSFLDDRLKSHLFTTLVAMRLSITYQMISQSCDSLDLGQKENNSE